MSPPDSTRCDCVPQSAPGSAARVLILGGYGVFGGRLARLPAAQIREYEEHGQFRFDVALFAPLTGGLIVRYRGQVE